MTGGKQIYTENTLEKSNALFQKVLIRIVIFHFNHYFTFLHPVNVFDIPINISIQCCSQQYKESFFGAWREITFDHFW